MGTKQFHLVCACECSENSLGKVGVGTKPGHWTGLDSGLDYGLDYGLNYGLSWIVNSVLELLFKEDFECCIAQ